MRRGGQRRTEENKGRRSCQRKPTRKSEESTDVRPEHTIEYATAGAKVRQRKARQQRRRWERRRTGTATGRHDRVKGQRDIFCNMGITEDADGDCDQPGHTIEYAATVAKARQRKAKRQRKRWERRRPRAIHVHGTLQDVRAKEHQTNQEVGIFLWNSNSENERNPIVYCVFCPQTGRIERTQFSTELHFEHWITLALYRAYRCHGPACHAACQEELKSPASRNI